MDKRPLGRSGISIAPLMFGGNVLGWTADEATSFSLLDAFVAGGFDAIDTADVYSAWVPGYTGGESEMVIGKSPRGRTVKRYMDDKGLGVVDALEAVAAETAASPAQVALAWVMGRPAVARLDQASA